MMALRPGMAQLLERLGAAIKRGLPDACLIALRLAGWTVVTTLAVLGCFTLLFLLLGDFTAAGFFGQLQNLASRFAVADAERQATFVNLISVLAIGLFVVMAICRRRSLAALFRLKEKAHG